MAALRAQIMGRQKQRHTSMVDMLAEKYGGGSTKGGNIIIYDKLSISTTSILF